MRNVTLKAGAGTAAIIFPEAMFPTDGLCGVHDNPHIRLLVMDCGIRVAIAAVELVNVPEGLIGQCRAVISARTGTALENIWIHATHAITTPHVPRDPAAPLGPPPGGKPSRGEAGGEKKGGPPPADPDGSRKRKLFLTAVLDAAAQAADQAAAGFREARMGIGTGRCGVNTNRDIETPFGWWVGQNPEGPSNKTATVVRLDGTDGKMIGALISYGIKPCAIDNSEMEKKTRLVSSDVPGKACSLLEERFGAPCLFAMSAAGDQVPREQAWGDTVLEDGTVGKYDLGVQAGLEMVDRLGKEMAEDLASILSKTVCSQESPAISRGCASVTVPTKERTPLEPTRQPVYTPDGGEYALTADVIAVGNLALVAVQPETNARTERELQEESPYETTLLLSMVNGGMKYMPDQSSYDRGTWEALSAMLMPGCAEQWTAAAEQKLKEMKENCGGADSVIPEITAVGESRPDGERITAAVLKFDGPLPDVESITVRERTILSREVCGNTVTLHLSEMDKASYVIPPMEHPMGPPPKGSGGSGGSGGPGGPGDRRHRLGAAGRTGGSPMLRAGRADSKEDSPDYGRVYLRPGAGDHQGTAGSGGGGKQCGSRPDLHHGSVSGMHGFL